MKTRFVAGNAFQDRAGAKGMFTSLRYWDVINETNRQIRQSRMIARTLGTFRAARYLRKRLFPLDQALHILVYSRGRWWK